VSEIHPTAIVDKTAKIGNRVSVGPYTIIEGNVVIGDETRIDSHVYIADGARIGNKCHIHKGAVVATLPQDLKFSGEETHFEIGDQTTIREFCTLNRGTLHSKKSRIGKNSLLMAYAHVAHDCFVGDNVVIANAVQMGGHVHINDWSIIGGSTAIHQFCHIGAHCMVGGGLRVTKDVPPYILCAHEPVKFAGLNIIGLRRRGFDRQVIAQLKDAYKNIYRSKLNVSQALKKLNAETKKSSELEYVISFINASNRGIIGA
jgi:UDP-N-acetylglucosamine acyltransferase